MIDNTNTGTAASFVNSGGGFATASFVNTSDFNAIELGGDIAFYDGASRAIEISPSGSGDGDSLFIGAGDAEPLSNADGGSLILAPGRGDGIGSDGNIFLDADALIGASNPNGNASFFAGPNNTYAGAIISANSNQFDHSDFAVAKARGFIGGETGVNSGDLLGSFSFAGFDDIGAMDYVNGATIFAIATDNFNSGNYGTVLNMETTAFGESIPESRVQIDESGLVIVQRQATNSNALSIESGGTTFGVSITVPDGMPGSYNFQLPSDVGSPGQVLSTDGSGGVLSWVSNGFALPFSDLGQ
ncbi:MAG: hypothetical protein MI865_00165, partial [Proteobacteria bacterium]|nr:hypothetical protein [Pseudomonadota bacterium]